RKSLDDFAQAFFGVDDGSFVTKTYTFDDVVTALNGIARNDWATFLRSRLDANSPPLDGIAASGWKLVYTDKESEYEKAELKDRKFADFAYSIGLTIADKDGQIADVRWNSAAVKSDRKPIELLVKNQDEYRTCAVDYHDGLQYPHLERASGPDYLSRIIEA